jgi:hypothetical protein
MVTDRKAWSCWAAGLLILAGALLAAPASAQEAVAQAPSLRWVPADAGIYSVMLRNREQLDAILNSKAWARLMGLPVIQMARQMLEGQWANPNGPLAAVRGWYEQPDNAALVRLLGELFEEEVFGYSGKNTADFFVLLQELQSANQYAPLVALLKAGPQAVNQPEMRIKVLLQAVADNADRLKIPDLVLGFRLSRTKPAQVAQRVEALEKALANAVPALQNHLKKTRIHGADVHTLVLDAKLVPWDQVPLQQFEDQPGQFDKLMKRLKEMKLTVAVSVRGNYVLIGLGEGTAGLQALGERLPNRLSERSELAPMAKAKDRRLTSIAYVSKEFQQVAAGGSPLEALAGKIQGWLKESGLSADQQAKIERDIKALFADVKRRAPEPGASLAFTFLTAQGSEGYAYDWTKRQGLDGSRPLSLLKHVGGQPLGFALGSSRGNPEDYELFVRLVKLGHQYFEELAVPKLPDEVKSVYEQFMKQAKPHLVRLDKATGKMLLPALDGQGGIVLDARLTSMQWHQAMPAADKALPMLELAVVLGVRDAALLRQAFQEYRQVFNGLMEVVARVAPVPIPDIQIPEPEVKNIAAGTLYYYPLPANLGLDPKLMPTGGLSAKVAVFTLSQDHAKRLLTTTTWKGQGGPLNDPARPLAGAAFFNWAGLVDAVAPWVEYALTQAGQGREVMDQVQTVAAILKVLRTYSSATYVEQGAVVTHSQTVIRDLEK